MRLAIDASIWQFQTQAGKGGSNPALRTLYYRLLRLLSLFIKPLFVFDGLNKPPFKRNLKTGSHGALLPNFITKQLLQLFGFPYHTAPGEAEAECALLQKAGIVDAVLSEDVDTMMFGCTLQLRNWSSENTRGNKVPTHVNAYRSEATKQGKSGLDSNGMILIALMSGGDYMPAGVPRCGVKIACEAAQAGFGYELCRLDKKDSVGLKEWRKRLEYELHVNESGFFRRRHKAISIPDNFPDRKVLGYYTDPTVSTAVQVIRLKDGLKWGTLNVPGLRQFVAEAFEWKYLSGAKKFIRGLAPAMLVDRLCQRYSLVHANGDLKAQEMEERGLVTTVCDRRNHFITDSIPELRIAYSPIDVVDLDLDSEEPDVEVFAASDSENESEAGDSRSRSRSPIKRGPSTYDPTQPEKLWVLESFVKIGVPLLVENWEEDMRDPKKFATRKARERATTSKKPKKLAVMKAGAMDAFVKTMKPGIDRSKSVKGPELPPAHSAPLAMVNHAQSVRGSPAKNDTRIARAIQERAPLTPKKSVSAKAPASTPRKTPSSRDSSVNPWTLSKRPSDTLNAKMPPGTRFSALGIYGPESPTTSSSPSTASVGDGNEDSQQLPTPTSNGSRRRRRNSVPEVSYIPEPSRSKKANRRLSFSEQFRSTSKSRPDTPDSLPSPSQLTCPLYRMSNQGNLEILAPAESSTIVNREVKRTEALLALRESLDGTWRNIKPWERNRAYIKTVFDDVEVIDLTRT